MNASAADRIPVVLDEWLGERVTVEVEGRDAGLHAAMTGELSRDPARHWQDDDVPVATYFVGGEDGLRLYVSASAVARVADGARSVVLDDGPMRVTVTRRAAS